MAFNVAQFALLQKRLTRLGFDRWDIVSESDVRTGAVLPHAVFIRHLLQRAFPDVTATFFARHPWFVIESDDAKLCEAFLKLLRQEFSYKPAVTTAQFLRHNQFAGAKVSIVLDALTLLSRAHAELQRHRPSSQRASRATSAATSANTTTTAAASGAPSSGRRGAGAAVGRDEGLGMQHQQLLREMRLLDLRHRALNRVIRAEREQPSDSVHSSGPSLVMGRSSDGAGLS